MSEQGRTPGPPTAPAGAPDDGTAVLVGLAAYTELAAFGLLASRSLDAPDLATRQTLAAAAGEALERQRLLLDVVGGDAARVLAPFDGAFTDFDARTVPGTWSEGLLKGVVGHGVAHDLCRELARGLPPAPGQEVQVAFDRQDPGQAATVVLTQAAADDAVLASRLALWGRRVVGEALGLVPALLGAHPVLADLARRARSAAAAPAGSTEGGDTAGDTDGEAAVPSRAEVQAWLMSRLTAEHTRRMDRMRLAA